MTSDLYILMLTVESVIHLVVFLDRKKKKKKMCVDCNELCMLTKNHVCSAKAKESFLISSGIMLNETRRFAFSQVGVYNVTFVISFFFWK